MGMAKLDILPLMETKDFACGQVRREFEQSYFHTPFFLVFLEQIPSVVSQKLC